MAQRRFVHLDEAGGRRERTRPDEIGRGLRRDDVDHVEPLLHALEFIAALLLERRDFRRPIDRDEP